MVRLYSPPEPKPWLLPPRTWEGTLPEFAVYWGHTALGLKEGIDFLYQSPVSGGRLNRGGTIIDFEELDVPVGIRVQGLYWHAYAGQDKIASDAMLKLQAESTGMTIIDIDEDDALRSPKYFVEEARGFRDHSRAGRGII